MHKIAFAQHFKKQFSQEFGPEGVQGLVGRETHKQVIMMHILEAKNRGVCKVWGLTEDRDPTRLPRRDDVAGIEPKRMNRLLLSTQGRDRYSQGRNSIEKPRLPAANSRYRK